MFYAFVLPMRERQQGERDERLRRMRRKPAAQAPAGGAAGGAAVFGAALSRIPEAQAAGGAAGQAGASLLGAAVGKVKYCPESSSEEYSLSDNDGDHEGGKVAVTV
jgi:hypothetical protein